MKVRLDALMVHLWLAALWIGTGPLAYGIAGLVLAIVGMLTAR